MPAKTWSTDCVRPEQGLSYWREAVCEAVLNVVPQASRERFRASISGQSFGSLRFASFSSTRHFIVREPAQARRAEDDHYLISFQRSGRSGLEQGGRSFWLEPSEIGLMDGAQPFRVSFPAPVSRILAVVPRRRLETRAPWLRDRTLRKISAASPFAVMAREHMAALAGGALDRAQAELLTDNLCNLLALATAEGPREQLHPDTALQAILAWCRQNLADPDLNPRAAAAHFGISLRTLHQRFETTGQSFSRWLLEARLEECHRLLADPHMRGRTISDIAFGAGFGDLSHFSKAFRTRFGETPRDRRNGH